jgi:type IV pilus assembly protein PilA
MLEKKEEGFTLVELLIVVAIIAILAAIAIPQFSKYRLRGYKSQIDSDTKNAYTAAQAYLIDNPSLTVTTAAALNDGGWQKTADVHFEAGNMTLGTGRITLTHNVLNTATKENNAVVFFNGRMNLPATP